MAWRPLLAPPPVVELLEVPSTTNLPKSPTTFSCFPFVLSPILTARICLHWLAACTAACKPSLAACGLTLANR